MVEPNFKERTALEFETVSKMEIWLRWLLLLHCRMGRCDVPKRAGFVAEEYIRSFKLRGLQGPNFGYIRAREAA